MRTQLEPAIGRFLAAWSETVCRHAVWVIVFTLAVSAGIGLYAKDRLGINADLATMLSEELPYRKLERQFFRSFPMFTDPLLVVVDGQTTGQAEDAAEALRGAIAARPGRFRSVFLPGGGQFFERNGFLYLDIQDLEELADALARAQPYIAELSRDDSLRGFVELLGDAVTAPDLAAYDVDLGDVLDDTRRSIEANLAERSHLLSWTQLLLGRDTTEADRRRVLLVDPVLDYGDLLPAREAIQTLREIVASLDLDDEEAVHVRITGDAALSFEEMRLVQREVRIAGLASFVLVGVALFAALRSLRVMVAVLLTLVVGLIWTAGFAAAAIGHLNPVSATFTVLFIGLGVDFGIHLGVRHRELLRSEEDPAEALRATVRWVGGSLTLCAASTAIGFFSFAPTEYAGVAELGLISGTGMFVSLFLSLSFLPALLMVGRPVRIASGPSRRVPGAALLELPERFPRSVLTGAALLSVATLPLLGHLRFDHDPLRLRDPSSDSASALRDLLEDGLATQWNMNVLVPDEGSAERVKRELDELPPVERTVSLSDWVPGDQDEKLAILADVSLWLGPTVSPDEKREPPTTPEQIAALRHFHDELGRALEADIHPELADRMRALREAIGRLLTRLDSTTDAGARIARLEGSLLGSFAGRLERLRASLDAQSVAIEDLPPDVRDHMVGRDGRLRIEVFPREDLSRGEALENFVEAVHGVAPEAIGGGVTILESGRAVVRSLRQALATALLAIALLLYLLWRRLLDVCLVLVPLSLAALLTAAASVLLDIPINFADVIVIPLVLGIGVDSGIHLVHRYRYPDSAGEHLLETSTARAVLFSALTTIASFGSLGFSSHPGMASLGQLLTLGVTLMLLCNMVVLPALVPLVRRATD